MIGYMGIDPGITGAIAILDEQGRYFDSLYLPVKKIEGKSRIDGSSIGEYVRHLKDKVHHIILEKVWGFGGGQTSAFSFGKSTGIIIGAVESNTTKEIKEVAPKTWQKALGFDPDQDPKEQALLYVQKHFPKVNLLKTSRSKVPHEGIVDAICLSAYCYLTNWNSNKRS